MKKLLALLLALCMLTGSLSALAEENLLDWVLDGIEDFDIETEELLDAPPAEELGLEDLLREEAASSLLLDVSVLRDYGLAAEEVLSGPDGVGLTTAGLLMAFNATGGAEEGEVERLRLGQRDSGEAVLLRLDSLDRLILIRWVPGEATAEALLLAQPASQLLTWYEPLLAALTPVSPEGLYEYEVELLLLEDPKAGLKVGKATWELSEDRRHVFVDRPSISGGSGKYTIAYNIYDADSQPVNYFYSAEARVAATPGYAGLFNVFIVVTDVNTGENNTQNIGWQQMADETTGQPLAVGTLTYEISPDRHSIFIDRPVVTGGSGIRTIAYNIYDSNSNPVNYFYSNERRVAATPGYDGRFNVFVVVSDQQTGEQNVQNIGWQSLGDEPEEEWPVAYDGVFYNLVDDEVVAYGGDKSMAELVFRDSVFGRPVVRIAESAFENFTALKRVTLPGSCVEIGAKAFKGCKALTGYGTSGILYLPESLKTVGVSAFENCAKVTKVMGRDGLSTLSSRCFAKSGLKEITLPDSVSHIASDAFAGCSGLVVKGNKDSYADLWCDQNGVTFSAQNTGRIQARSSNVFQDMRSFAFDHFSYGNDVITELDDCVRFVFNCDQSDYDKLEALVNELCNGKYNYELIGKGQSTWNWGHCWTLGYTGTAVTTTTLSNQYDSNMIGNVNIWIWNPNYAGTGCNCFITISLGLTYGDLGLRLQEDNSVTQQGEIWKQAPAIDAVTQVGRGQVRVRWTPKAEAACYSVYEMVSGSAVLKATVTGHEAILYNVSEGEHSYVVRPRSKDTSDAVFGDYSNAVAVTVGETYVPPQSDSSMIVQDFKSFATSVLNFGVGDTPSRGPKMSTFSWECTSRQISLMETYVKMLTSGSYNFKLNHYQLETNRVAGEWLLDYTGTGQPGERLSGVHNGNYSGDVLLWYYQPSPYGSGTIKCHLWIAGGVTDDTHEDFGLQFGDLGLRCDGTNVNVPDPDPTVGTPSVEVQDPRFFMPDLSWGDEKVYDNGNTMLSFKGKKTQLNQLSGYVERLTDGNHNLRLNQYYEQTGGSFGSWSLTYYGTGDVGDPMEQMFVNGYYGHVTMYFAVSGSSIEGQLHLTKGLKFIDQGMRLNGNDVIITRIGESSNASLTYLSGGRYGTSDGRFAVKPGQAQVYRDGAKYTTSGVQFVRKAKTGKEEFLINNYYMSECLAVMLPWGQMKTDDEYNSKDLGLAQSAHYSINSQNSFFGYSWSRAIGAGHGKDYLMLHYPPKNDFQDALVRVMLWDEAADVCVLYAAAAFFTAPYLVECLMAVKISSATDGDDHTEKVTITRGSTVILSYDAHALEALAETYSWEIVEGEGVVSFPGSTNLSTCSVRGVKAGTAIVRVSYNFSFYAPNVLTGYREYGFATWTKEYQITVK
ncbi:MAG: leucine-rich repeat domain-containing protein [Clostridia bacterium]|nr:leucine-rich repeat domain-containing protein [Clostridia bacterium]